MNTSEAAGAKVMKGGWLSDRADRRTRCLVVAAVVVVLGFSRAIAAPPPPLIVEPNQHSYTFAVPEGWECSFEQATDLGVRLVCFGAGSDFHRSESVIYVNEACHRDCAGKLEEVIDHEISESRAGNPKLVVEEAAPIRLKSGAEASIRILTGAADRRQAKEAIAFIEHRDVVVLVVLSTMNPGRWTQDYASFSTLVAGHEFFDCDTPGLVVPCRGGREVAEESFEAARELATRDMATPEGRLYDSESFLPDYSERHAETLRACFEKTPRADASAFTFVIALDGEGHPLQIALSTETDIALCLRSALLADRFPPPPFRGFHELVEMRFEP